VTDTASGGFVCSQYGSSDSCTPADYATPAVPIQPMSVAYEQMKDAWLAHGPSTETPTSAALEGAISYAQEWAGAHPGHVTIVVLATDGEPTECDTDLTHIGGIAAAGVNAPPSVRTFVIGVGSSLTNLNGIAAAGGTAQAYMVDTGGDVYAQVLAAFNAIRSAAITNTAAAP
jgi:hypothetical protein